jgi:Ti-type conjugative transfer relaxase TraA
MAIYHLSAKIISRARGQSVTAAAAYRSESVLRDERQGRVHDYAREGGVAHAEIMSPDGAPAWVQERQALWNRVEAAERRKDSQLARLIEVSLPAELSPDESVVLLRDFIAEEFVSQGMVADFCIRRRDSHKPYAHILLTLREATASGFGPKVRHWNRKSNLVQWRAAWAERANHHLARAGHAARIDHRTLDAQHSELLPERRVGIAARWGERPLPGHLEDRLAEQKHIARQNGEMIAADPIVALRALCAERPSFTHQELVDFLRTRTGDAAQLDAALAAILGSSELAAVEAGDAKPARFTALDLLEAEKSLLKRVTAMSGRRGHGVPPPALALPPEAQTPQLRAALDHVLGEGDVKAMAIPPGAGKSAVLDAAREAWTMRGLRVIGAALSMRAAERLQATSGIESRTLASRELEWSEGRDPVTAHHVVVIDGAEMIGGKQLERLFAVADRARGKLVLIGDAQQLAAMGPASPLHAVLAKIGAPAPTVSS